MLQSLEIRDFALIEHLRVDWTPGFNILTGETGAGKSILIDALNTVLGGKAGPSAIRAGAERAYIEAEFTTNPLVILWLKEQQLIEDESPVVTVCREINKSGSKIRINGTLVNSAIAQALSEILLTIHAQHEARTMMSAQSQLELLDNLGDQAHEKLVQKVKTLFARRRDLSNQLREMQISEDERLKRLDFARFQLAELTEANLNDIAEDDDLSHQQKILANVSQLESHVNTAYDRLNGSGESEATSVVDLLQQALFEVEKAMRLDEDLKESAELLQGGLTSIEEASTALRRYSDALETNPEVLAFVDSRLALLASIKRKYGPTLNDAIEKREALRQELEKLENAQSTIDDLESDLGALNKELKEETTNLSHNRRKAAAKLSKAIAKELADLGMEHCRFEIVFEEKADESEALRDRIEFMIAPNPGQPLLPLSKIASGGELSRIMLAIKSIFANVDRVATVIFDEIDTGLSGRVLQSMRDKLAVLARSHQILCITHQPIIASVADNHIHVRKEQTAQHTRVSAAQLGSEERLKALASMASGEENEQSALQFARSLMDQADKVRGSI